MKTTSSTIIFILLFTLITLNSCGAIETIFKAGMWWAFFLVALVLFVVIWIVGKARRK